MTYTITLCTLMMIALFSEVSSQTAGQSAYTVDAGGGVSSAGGVTLFSSIGQPAVAQGSAGRVSLEGGFIPGDSSSGSTLELLGEGSWNMVSVPVIVGDYRRTSLYPSAISVAFLYNGTYQARDTLNNGIGYWIKFSGPNAVDLAGTTIQRETLDVNTGWNLVGCPSYPTRTMDIIAVSPTTITSNFFGYSGSSGYFIEDTLRPTHGYWVKVSASGRIIMAPSSVIPPSAVASFAPKSNSQTPIISESEEPLSIVLVRDAAGRERKLSFSTRTTNLDLSKYELPPVPPTYDVRYISNRSLETMEAGKTKEVAIRISSADYPLVISWPHNETAELIVDGKTVSMMASGDIQIAEPGTVVKLRLMSETGRGIPKEFALHQNYPNPFNPSTLIRYDLPVESRVTLRIYDLLGREVKVLVDGVQDSGFRQVEWNSTNDAGAPIASGLYLYRLDASGIKDGSTSFSQVRKMLIVR